MRLKKRRELTINELEALERLKKNWDLKKRELKITQEQVGLACGWGGQSAFSQYFTGNVPLNVEAVLRIAKVLKIHPAEIMPEINVLLPNEGFHTGTVREKEALCLANKIIELSGEQQFALKGIINAFVGIDEKKDTGH
jgi:transcriptional regulator with XRE-family HTH domain